MNHRRWCVVIAAVIIGSTALALDRPGEESTAATVADGPPPPSESWRGNCIYDNGDTDGSDAYSNGVNLGGGRRALLDDFEIPGGQTWMINGIRSVYLWQNDVGFVFEVQVIIREDDGGEPGDIIATTFHTGHSESTTGRFFFGFSEWEGWSRFEPIVLGPGRYWFEMAMDAQTNNFWLVTRDVQHNECWVDYDDFYGLVSGSQQFGVQADLSFCLTGDDCAGDVNDDGDVGFYEIIEILRRWGPCFGCPEDLDGDGEVGFSDILLVLAGWGACP